MNARAKIENLTNTWYGFAVFSAVATFLMSDSGLVWRTISGGFSLFVSLLLTFFIGRRLLNKGKLTRWILIAASGVFTLLGAYTAAQASWTFVHAWELKWIVAAASSAISSWMMAKSFRVLTDASVKAYFA